MEVLEKGNFEVRNDGNGIRMVDSEEEKALKGMPKPKTASEEASSDGTSDCLLTAVPFEYVFGHDENLSDKADSKLPTESTSRDSSDNLALPPLGVEFQNIHFRYPQRPDTPVLDNLSLTIPAGCRTVVLGRSGSGKSTLVQLLAGMYAPQQGRVLVDGENIFDSSERLVWVRNQLGVITQEPLLFSASIKENIGYGLDSNGNQNLNLNQHSEIKRSASLALVDEFADEFPEKLDTPAGSRGSSLSGGQKQRVCLARALARQPRMLVFDEATSALDLKSERLVHDSLRKVLGVKTNENNSVNSDSDSSENSSAANAKVTCLMITHRLSALEFADRIAVMDEGRVVQEGGRDELIANPGEALRAILEGSNGGGPGDVGGGFVKMKSLGL